MPSLREVEIYLKGLWLLFRQQPAGLAFLDLSDRGALRSFWSALWSLPAILISFAWWRLLYLQELAPSQSVGGLFFFRLALVEATNWIVPLVLVGLVCWVIGLGDKFSSIVVVVNWLALPISYAYGTLILMLMMVPSAAGFVTLLWFVLTILLITTLFRVLRMVVGDQVLTLSALILMLLVPSMILSEWLQAYLGILPG